MTSKASYLPALGLVLALAACQSTRPDRDYVQTNIVDKDLFQGEWYYIRTVVDHDYESWWMGYYGTFRGDQSSGVELWNVERIRWVVDENYLYAHRADPLVTGADEDEFEPDYRSGVVAAFPIEAHMDIIRSYNSVTGEKLNVVKEDQNERPWYERKYMRVDWSQNTVTGFYWTSLDAFGSEGMITREATTFTCLEGSDREYTDENGETVTLPVCRDEWMPQVRYTDPEFDAAYGEFYTSELREDACRNPVTGEVPENCDGSGLPYMFSFVNQEIWSPSYDAFGYMGNVPFSSVRVAVRNTFLRSPESPSYEGLIVQEGMWDRFGVIRLERPTYTGGEGEDPVEGIEPLRGLTDLKEYWGARHNMWVDYRNGSGEVIPVADREKRHTAYYLNKEFPEWLVPTAFQVVSEWNQQLMRAYYLNKGWDLPADPSDYDCRVEWGAAESLRYPEMPDSYSAFDDIYEDPPRFVGEDCVLVLRVNSANLPDGEHEDCVGTRIVHRDEQGAIDTELSNVEPFGELLGDYRFHFMTIIDTPGAGFSGVSLPQMDLRTGELVSSNCNMTLESIQAMQTSVLLSLGLSASLCSDDDLIEADLCAYLGTLEQAGLAEIMGGEDVRSYFANLGQVDTPVSPVVPEALNGPESAYGGTNTTSTLTSAIEMHMAATAERALPLQGPEGEMLTFSKRVHDLEDSRFESLVYDNPETLALLASRPGMEYRDVHSMDPSDEAVLDEISLFRTPLEQQMMHERNRMERMSSHFMYELNPFVDYGYMEFARDFMDKGWSVRQVALWIGQSAFYNVMLHEMGHSIGMEHNFGGSIDYRNYKECYWDIADEHPWPDPDAFGTNPAGEFGELTFEETMEWSRAVAEVDDARDDAGINKCQYTSIMDYSLDFLYDYNPYDGLGSYDKAFVAFSYAGKAEAWDGDPRLLSESGSPRWEKLDPRGVDKVYWTYYLGGEVCETDADCPYSAGSGRLAAAQQDAGVTQTCKVNPRLPTGADPDVMPRVCSNFDDDLYNRVRDWDDHGSAPYVPVEYMYCTDNRTGDISWCNRWDRGGSFREVIRNWSDYYDKIYPFSWFRRARRLYGGASYWRTMVDMVKIYQHWLYRYFYEPGYADLRGPLYAYDQYLAGLDALNFFARVIGTPDVGSYDLDPVSGNYYKVDNELGEGDLDVELGMGKHMWSAWQDGPMGIMNLERMGLHWDKIYALQAMAVRDWNLMYSYDERFTINFYTMFEWEMMKLFGGVIMDEPGWYAPRWVTDPETSEQKVYYPYIWGGVCGFLNAPCPTEYYDEHYAGVPAFDNATNEIIRNYAAIFSLAEFPIFYDTAYEQQLFVCEEGSGYCFDIDHSEMTEHDEYELFYSERLHKSFQAVAYEDPVPEFDTPPQVDISIKLLERANDLQASIDELEAHQAAGTCPPSMTAPCDEELEEALAHTWYELSQHESFLVNLMDLQRAYGITSWL